MIVHFDTSSPLSRATCGNPDSLVYGVTNSVSISCVYGVGDTPLDIGVLGIADWRIALTADELTPTSSLAYIVYEENIASSSTLSFQLPVASVEAYKFIAGAHKRMVRLCVSGYEEGEDTPSVRLVVPVPLDGESVSVRRPVDLSTALIEALTNAASSGSSAAGRAAASAASAAASATSASASSTQAQAAAAIAVAASEKLPNPTPEDVGKTPVVNSAGNYTLSTVPVGSATWGSIYGDLEDQTDLANVLQDILVIQPYEFYFSDMSDIIYSIRVAFATSTPEEQAVAACNGLYEFSKPSVNGKPMYRKDSGHALFFGVDGKPVIAESETAETYIVKARDPVLPGGSLADLKWVTPIGKEYPEGSVDEEATGVMKAVPGLVVSLTCNAGGYVIADMHVSGSSTYICMEGISRSSACSEDDTGATFVAYALVQRNGNAVPMLDVSSI